MSILVVNVAAITFTFEAARYIHTNAVLAHLRHQLAFVEIFNETRRVNDGTRSSGSAQRQIFRWNFPI